MCMYLYVPLLPIESNGHSVHVIDSPPFHMAPQGWGPLCGYRSIGTALKRICIGESADLRCEVGGGVLQELDDLRVLLLLGGFQRRVAILRRRGGRARRWRGGHPGAGAGRRRERRRGACAGPLHTPPPATHPARTLAPAPPTTPSSALCAIAHRALDARVGPRLEQRLGAGSVAFVSRPVQRRPLELPRRGGGPTDTRVSARRRSGGWRVPETRMRRPSPAPTTPPQPRSPPLSPACMRAGRPRAGSRQRGGSTCTARRRRGAATPAGHRPPAGQQSSGAQPPPLTLYPHTPRRHTPQQGRGAHRSGHSGWRPWR